MEIIEFISTVEGSPETPPPPPPPHSPDAK